MEYSFSREVNGRNFRSSEAVKAGLPSKAQYYVNGDIFDASLLKCIDLRKAKCNIRQVENVCQPGDGLVMRPLHITDVNKGYLKLLSQLTEVGDVSHDDFVEKFRLIQNRTDSYYILVIEDTYMKIIVGTCSLVVEHKFIHSCGLRGRLEDLVVLREYRSRQLGKLLLESLRQLAKHLRCYKVSLECKDHLVPYYEQFGFQKEEGNSNFLVQRFPSIA
uniref:Glucosamine 6-phosphate N-acetyltransferase n=1 Tax=Trichuris muris TaxID=70415 RepID=A0A5S6QYG6_TRIMR